MIAPPTTAGAAPVLTICRASRMAGRAGRGNWSA